MVLTFKQIENLVIQNQYKGCVLYQGHLDTSDLKGQAIFEKIEATTHEMIIGRLEEIKNQFGGSYTVCLGGTGATLNWRHMQRFQASFTREVNGVKIAEAPAAFSPTDRATLVAEIKADFKKELEAEAAKKELEDLRAENANLRSFGGKAGLALDNLFKMYFNPQELVNTMMQGTQTPGSDEVSEDEMNEALIIIIEALGESTVIKLSKKLQDGTQVMGQPIATVVQNFVNN